MAKKNKQSGGKKKKKVEIRKKRKKLPVGKRTAVDPSPSGTSLAPALQAPVLMGVDGEKVTHVTALNSIMATLGSVDTINPKVYDNAKLAAGFLLHGCRILDIMAEEAKD